MTYFQNNFLTFLISVNGRGSEAWFKHTHMYIHTLRKFCQFTYKHVCKKKTEPKGNQRSENVGYSTPMWFLSSLLSDKVTTDFLKCHIVVSAIHHVILTFFKKAILSFLLSVKLCVIFAMNVHVQVWMFYTWDNSGKAIKNALQLCNHKMNCKVNCKVNLCKHK